MTNLICDCKTWQYYVKNYDETFYWRHDTEAWYVGWVHLSTQDGYTQVSRYAIPIEYCPLCGKRLKNP